MFRLDFADENGAIHSDANFSCQHMKTARAKARELANGEQQPVVVSISGRVQTSSHSDGATKTLPDRAVIVILPDGSAKPPATAKTDARSACTRDGDVPCFCPSCRAERRDARRSS
jgi:hypothetical protein